MAEATKQIGKPELTTLVDAYTGKTEKLALASDGRVWNQQSLRKDGFPNRTYAAWGYLITRNKWGRAEGKYAVHDTQTEMRASILRDRIKGLQAQVTETFRELEALYLGDNNTGQGGS
mgnify:CR=1 FL=1